MGFKCFNISIVCILCKMNIAERLSIKYWLFPVWFFKYDNTIYYNRIKYDCKANKIIKCFFNNHYDKIKIYDNKWWVN